LRHEGGIPQGSEINEVYCARKRPDQFVPNGDRDRGLADTSGPDDRNKAGGKSGQERSDGIGPSHHIRNAAN
jgi:hypothetical protein